MNDTKELLCPKGHKKLKAYVSPDDYGNFTWVHIICATCGRTLHYDGA